MNFAQSATSLLCYPPRWLQGLAARGLGLRVKGLGLMRVLNLGSRVQIFVSNPTWRLLAIQFYDSKAGQ